MELKKVNPDHLNEYSLWLQSNNSVELFQSIEWAEFKKESWSTDFFFLEKKGERIGSVTVHSRILPIVNKPLLYLPRGPVLRDYDDPELWSEFTEAISRYAKSLQAVYVKLDPAVITGEKIEGILGTLGFISLKSTRGFGGFEPAATILCDLSGSEEDVFMRIPKKTRYNIRYPEKNGVIYKHLGSEGLDDFLLAMQDTSRRANFYIRSKGYYQRLLETFGDRAELTVAYHDGAPLAAGITLMYGDKAYAYSGGQLSSHKNLRAFYGLIWERMKWAKNRGARYFDLYGIPVDRDESNRLHGLYAFKKSFGGEEYDYIGELDLPINKPLYQVWRFLTRAQSSVARLRRRLFGRVRS